jgi:hypothetical protein
VNDSTVKLILGAGLFATWVALVVFKVPNSDDIIAYCKDGLVALGAYHFGTTRGAPAANNFPAAN